MGGEEEGKVTRGELGGDFYEDVFEGLKGGSWGSWGCGLG